MKLRKMIAVFAVGSSLLLGGCMNMDGLNQDPKNNGETKTASNQQNSKDIYESVQNYTGQGYELQNGEENDKIAEAHRNEIEKAVKKFFLDKYKTKVKVHNIVGNKDGATVFVESIGEPHFHTYAIVPITVNSKKVLTDEVWSQEGEVERAIRAGLYEMVNKEAFNKLDQYLKKIVEKYPVVGKTTEAIDNTGSSGYETPYYYVDVSESSLKRLFNTYLKNPYITRKQLQKLYNPKDVEPDQVLITIQLFMKEKQTAPNKKLFESICKDVEESSHFPRGSYGILLNDNRIIKRTGTGFKKNSLERSDPNEIIKE